MNQEIIEIQLLTGVVFLTPVDTGGLAVVSEVAREGFMALDTTRTCTVMLKRQGKHVIRQIERLHNDAESYDSTLYINASAISSIRRTKPDSTIHKVYIEAISGIKITGDMPKGSVKETVH